LALRLPVLCGQLTDLRAKDGRLVEVVVDGARIETDGLVLTGDWRPEIGMAREAGLAIDRVTRGVAADAQGRTMRTGVYACGNVLRGVHTAGQCWSEGRALARTVLADMALARRSS
ncbi:MAG: NAD(P)/FAD-dependent oxidoreductase, partial [Paracoccaceae bacterium]